MRLIKSVSRMQRQATAWRKSGVKVGFVPTMGYLHAGHISLVARARKLVGPRGRLVLSIYVNPTQFGPREDFSRYPRDLARDAQMCKAAGVDVVFAPDDAEMYPSHPGKEYSTYVVEETLSARMEGASRPTHFRGVTTIVAKLFNLVLPHFAVFGAKDYQQATIIQRLVRDLNFPVQVVVAPTLRERDGLAMSSRNKSLVGDLRRQSLVLSQALTKAREIVTTGRKPVQAARLRATLKVFIEKEPDARLDYVEFFCPNNLVPVKQVIPGTQMALAVFIGKTRLIDNALI
jgi:pantoate--beta-alanine ligase